MRKTNRSQLSRRDFLAATASSGAALVIGFHLPWGALAQNPERRPPNPFNAWIKIDRQNQVTLIVAKSEMGQGIMTSLPMILADELEVPWATVRIEQAPTDPRVYSHGTGGSGSVADSYLPLRRAAAAAREMLIGAAAQVWNVSPETCYAERGVVVHGPRKKRLEYGELVEAATKLAIPDFNKVTLKNSDDFKIVGTSIARADIPAKVNGTAQFGIDVRVPEMHFAVIARCPTFGGKPAHFDDTRAKAVPGVKQIFEVPAKGPGAWSAGGIAVVAGSTWAAIQGRDALSIEWDHGSNVNENSTELREQFESLMKAPGKVIRNEGDVDKAMSGPGRKIEALYELPFQAHATMEPMNCTVDIRADRAEVWAPTQAPDWTLSVVAPIAGLKPEQVIVHTTLMGGGFGRRYQADFAVEAAQVAKVFGKPVKLLWTREDDMTHDFYRPAAYHRLQGVLDDHGRPLAWHHHMSSTSIRGFWDPPDRAKPERSEVGGADDLPYAIPNLRVEYSAAKSRVPVAWWRSVEHSINGFVVESFIDELAVEAKQDPLDFRLSLLAGSRKLPNLMYPEASPLDTERLRNVLSLVKEKSNWGKPLGKGVGRGAACHYSFDTYVAEVAEVSVNGKEARVQRVVCAVDCGRAINPDGIKAQMESGIVYGLTAALKGEIKIDKGAAVQTNFDTYPMLRINEMPIVEVYIVPSKERPTGVGEPGTAPIAPAVTNAIFAATGKRVRQLPIRLT
jgi:isoquinoline 1-oxidoreductase beta subunit